ncbi:two-component system sensor histidine kinase KdpD [Geodermatophilus bullaregiensis]|uniref:ATP-binding protein n=1 Tax=Geodermatophilus bullaregiensis TaxID=1564160 RepID=UPI001EF88B49|nr:ATP-binding protein [Geodermatophilus bullaregiensis]MBM7804982.1 two-component system sensor histidine kinase KdpD [Geodermatophilus bullaregiensis]
MPRGTLRIYLGAAPGVGKTYAVLGEARRRSSRGTDVVVGLVETHDRPHTVEQLDGLEILPRAEITHRGVTRTELDVEAVLTRRPEVVVIDELAHTNAPGACHAKRWEDIDQVLGAGISVLTTVDVQHLESLNDVVEQITGVRPRETVPDAVVRRADQIELIDMSPEALRRRLAHGNVYPAEEIDAALADYFRIGNLAALRELALLWLADRVDEGLRRYRTEHAIDHVWEARERVVVALTGGPEGDTLIRRGARIAARSARGKKIDLLAVHVLAGDGPDGASTTALQRQLVEHLGGTFHQVVGDDVPQALLEFARAEEATQLVIGTSRRSRWARALRAGIGAEVVARSGEIDVHLVTHPAAGGHGVRLPPLTGALDPRRRWLGLALTVLGVPALTAACLAASVALSLAGVMLVFLLLVLAVALVGGLWPALAAAVVSSLSVNWFFTPPTGRLHVDRVDNLLALGAYLLTAVAVATVVDRSARRAADAARSRAETAMLASLSRSVLAGDRALPTLLEQIREAFGLTSVSMVERTDGGERTVGSCGDPAPRTTDEVAVTDSLLLRLCGRLLSASDRRVLVAFAEQAAVALQQGRLTAQAAEAARLAAANSMRTALLAAVSHDLRTPLAGIKAASSALRSTGLRLSEADRAELVETVDASADRLAALVDNLLDMSRLQAGAVTPALSPSDLPDVVARALSWLDGEEQDRVRLDWPDELPPVLADPGLLERVVANLVGNAARHARTGPISLSAGAVSGRVELRVADRGPGIPPADRERVFVAFQRLGDSPSGQGVGLGLAVARGLTEAMGGVLTVEDTPGGGVTMVVSLAVADAAANRMATPVPATAR